MQYIHISPIVLSYFPIVLLELACLIYLGTRRNKDAAIWWLLGWMAGLTVVMGGLVVAYSLYHPNTRFIFWLAGTYGKMFSVLCFVQFAYNFPSFERPHEARLAFWLGVIIIGVEMVLSVGEQIQVNQSSVSGFTVYSFPQFLHQTVFDLHGGWFNAVIFFNLSIVVGYAWSIGLWVRQILRGGWRNFGRNILSPTSTSIRISRNYVLVAILAICIIGTAFNENIVRVTPSHFFTILYISTLFLFILLYLNDAPQPTSFMVKLGSGTLTIVLILLIVVNSNALANVEANADELRRRDTLQTILNLSTATDPPQSVDYVALRPAAGGIFSDSYTMLFSRGAISAETLQAEDALLRTGITAGHFPMEAATVAQMGWLGWSNVRAPEMIATVTMPTDQPSYRGALGDTSDHYIRYAVIDNAMLYEVGFSYAQFRAFLHQQAMAQIWLTLIVSILSLFLVTVFYYYSLQRPLKAILLGINAVEAGDLDVSVPVTTWDEARPLTLSFNKMVRSLRDENRERLRAEAQYQSLNESLEERISQRTHELNVLYNVSAVGSHAVSIQNLLADSLDEIDKVTSATVSAIYLQEDAGLTRAVGTSAQLDELAQTLDLTAWIDQPREPRLITQQELVVSNVLFILLLSEQTPQGLLAFARESAFTLDEIALLMLVGEQLARALETHQLREVAEEASLIREREEIAQRLHDTATQSLYGLNMLTEAGQAQLEMGSHERVERTFDRIGRITQQAIKEMRLFIFQLRPPELEEEGLAAALQQRLDAVEGRFDVATRLHDQTTERLPLSIENAFYWIAQEALNNVLRHAKATQLSVVICLNDTMATLSIQDDGCGFALNGALPAGMGLQGIERRSAEIGGSCTWQSAVGQGTILTATVPLEN